MKRSSRRRCLPLVFGIVNILSMVACADLRAQPWSPEGYRMSAMRYDSLGFRILIDDQSSRGRSAFDRILQSECSSILQRNGIHYVPQNPDGRDDHYSAIVIDVTVQPLDGGRGTDELYYGTISFQREVSFSVADRPHNTVGSTWSMTFGGQARDRIAIVSDIEARLMDFLEDYLKLNSAKWIWK